MSSCGKTTPSFIFRFLRCSPAKGESAFHKADLVAGRIFEDRHRDGAWNIGHRQDGSAARGLYPVEMRLLVHRIVGIDVPVEYRRIEIGNCSGITAVNLEMNDR
jgi:hypothetical protein